MRRSDRQVTDPARIREIITACTCCRIGLCDSGRAYIVPLNFGIEEDGHYVFYFHSAMQGRKIDLLRKTDWVSFEMDTGHAIVEGEKAHSCTAIYHCVMGGGHVRLLEDPEEKVKGLCALMVHDTGNPKWSFDPALVARTAVIRLDVEELTCKVRA